MTRTRTGEYKDPSNAPRERRQSRNGFSDPRAIPKKAGAGNGNWGVPGCELNQQEQNSALSGNISTSPAENKITVVDSEAFAKLHNSLPSNQAQSTANGDQASSEAGELPHHERIL